VIIYIGKKWFLIAMDFFCHTVDVDVRVYEKLEAVQSSIAVDLLEGLEFC